MFKPVRVVATIIFLASIVLVFLGAFVIDSDVSAPPPLPVNLADDGSAAAVHQYVVCISDMARVLTAVLSQSS